MTESQAEVLAGYQRAEAAARAEGRTGWADVLAARIAAVRREWAEEVWDDDGEV